MPESSRSSRRPVIVGGIAAAIIVVVIIIIVASSGDDSDSSSSSATTTTSALVIQSPATVTGITGVSGAPQPSGSATTNAPNTYPLVRTLATAGKFDCTNLGSWQPFAEIQLAVPVGQPATDSTCGDSVLDLPEGFCTDTCSEVPADWRVVEDPDVTPQALMLIIAPTTPSTNTAQFLCIRDFVPQNKQILPAETSLTDACLSVTSNSVEIPYVPPVTSDIPYVPPPVSVDIPTSTG